MRTSSKMKVFARAGQKVAAEERRIQRGIGRKDRKASPKDTRTMQASAGEILPVVGGYSGG